MNSDKNSDNNNVLDPVSSEVDFSKEIKINADGTPVLSRCAVARLTGVNEGSIRKNLASIASSRNTSPALKTFNGQNFTGSAPLPDFLAFALITHYAYCAQHTTEAALKNATYLGGVRFREWCYKVTGHQLPNQEKQAHFTKEELIAKSLDNLQIFAEQGASLITQTNEIIAQFGQLIAQRDQLIEQRDDSISEQKILTQVIVEINEREKKLLDSEIEAQKRRAELRLLPHKQKELKQFLQKREYDVFNENIPLQHLALTFNYCLADTHRPLGRNRLYKIFRTEGICWEHNNEIDAEFYEKGYFKKDLIELPSGNISRMAFCTPLGWKWLDHRFQTDWAKYVI